MATTYIKPHKQATKRTALQSMKDRFDYGLNPEKLGVVSAYLCDPETAHAEFMLVKASIRRKRAGRRSRGGRCAIKSGKPLLRGRLQRRRPTGSAMKPPCAGQRASISFFVCTHTDKGHIHNHIYYNSTAYDRSRKFRNFIGSSFALRRLSDRVCLEHALSVVERPKLHSKGRFLHYGQWQGEARPPSQKEQICWAIDVALSERPADFADFLRRMEAAGFQVVHGQGRVISFRAPGHDRAARLWASTLGAGYGPEDIQAVIDGKAPTRQLKQARPRPAPQRVNLLIDIQEKMRQGKGPAYERWAKVYNLKQMAAALQFLQEHGLTDYDALAEQTTAAVDRFHALAGEIQSTEARLSQTSELMAAVVSYAKTRPVFDGYKAAKYSKKYLAQHEAELAGYRAAKAAINDILCGAKLPKMDTLKKERRELADKKKALYAEYREAQRQMRELVAVKGGVDHLLGLTDGWENKAQER